LWCIDFTKAGETALHKACRANLLQVVQAMCAGAAFGDEENRSVNVFNKASRCSCFRMLTSKYFKSPNVLFFIT
jgi:hypothetical protein